MRLLHDIENKCVRYYRLLTRVRNWPAYLLRKTTGFGKSFRFKLRDFPDLEVPRTVMGTFRECYLDQIYLRHIPGEVLAGKSNPVVVDIGGHVGYFAISLFARFPQATVHSVEPHPLNFRALEAKKTVLPDDRFHAHHLAISDRDGQVTLHTQTLDQFTTRSAIETGGTDAHAFTVEAEQLQTFVDRNGMDTIDLLKVDCEGAEYSILYGTSDATLGRIGAMCIETHEPVSSDAQSVALAKWLRSKGYRVKRRKLDATGYIWAWRTSNTQSGHHAHSEP